MSTRSIAPSARRATGAVRARRGVTAVLALTLGLALTACGNDHESRDVANLEGSWELVEFDQADIPADPAVESTLDLADGKAGGNAGVNTFRGTYEAEDGKISFGRLATTKKTGEPNAIRQEQRFLAALELVENFEYDDEDDELELKDERDETLVVLRGR